MATLGNIDAVLITTTTNAIIQAQGSDQLLLLKVTACNTDGSDRTVSVWRAPSGGTATTGELLWDGQTVKAGETVTLPLSGKSLVMNQQLFASASVASVVNLSVDYAKQ